LISTTPFDTTEKR